MKYMNMKLMNNYWLSVLLMLVITFCSIGCQEDDTVSDNTDTGDEIETAWIYAYRTEGPEGRAYYMSAHEEIPSEPDISVAVELGPSARISSFGAHPYTVDGDAGTVTKWSVDNTTLEITQAGGLGLANTAIADNVEQPIAFISETQAFLTNLAEGAIVEFNPTTMEITTVHDVEPLPDAGGELNHYAEWWKYIADGKIIMPVDVKEPVTCCEFYGPNNGAALIAVFDPASGTLEYNTDDRMFMDGARLMEDENGDFFIFPHREHLTTRHYFNVDPSINTELNVLKVNRDGTFDPNFSFDLTDVFQDIKGIQIPTFVNDNKFAMSVLNDPGYEFPAEFDDRNQHFNAPGYEFVLVDMETNEVEPFTGLDPYFSSFLMNTIEGKPYLGTFGRDEAGDRFYGIVRVDSPTEFADLSRWSGGSFQHVNKLDLRSGD